MSLHSGSQIRTYIGGTEEVFDIVFMNKSEIRDWWGGVGRGGRIRELRW